MSKVKFWQGFVTTNDPDGERAMAYYDGSDLHFYWDLYSTFAMSDHHFCSLLTGTWSNHGTSCPARRLG
jgi:phospholipase C